MTLETTKRYYSGTEMLSEIHKVFLLAPSQAFIFWIPGKEKHSSEVRGDKH